MSILQRMENMCIGDGEGGARPSLAVHPVGAIAPGMRDWVDLPAVYVLERHHVEESLALWALEERSGSPVVSIESIHQWTGERAPLTLWIHFATSGIDGSCAFYELLKNVRRRCRICVRPEPESVIPRPSPTAVLLGALVRRIGEYEPDLVDIIHAFATHKVDKIRRVGACFTAWILKLKEVALPNTLTHIGFCAFHRNSALTVVTLPNTLTHIGDCAFFECTGLKEMTLPNSLIHIGNKAFQGCTGLTELTLPDSLIHIGDFAFFRCSGLICVTMPTTHPFIGPCAFQGCPCERQTVCTTSL